MYINDDNQGFDIKLLTESLEFAMEPQINNESGDKYLYATTRKEHRRNISKHIS